MLPARGVPEIGREAVATLKKSGPEDARSFASSELVDAGVDKSIAESIVAEKFGGVSSRSLWSFDVRDTDETVVKFDRVVREAIDDIVAAGGIDDKSVTPHLEWYHASAVHVEGVTAGVAARLVFHGEPQQLKTDLDQAKSSSDPADQLVARYVTSQLLRGFFVSVGLPDVVAKKLGKSITRWFFGPLSEAARHREALFSLVEKVVIVSGS